MRCQGGGGMCNEVIDVVIEEPGHEPRPLCLLCLFLTEPLGAALFRIPARGRA